MFIQVKLQDVINVAPDKFGQDHRLGISERIGDKYVGKILPKPINGLVVALWGLEKVGDENSNTGYIFPGDGQTFFGDVSYKVTFTLAVFQPKVNELFTGTLVSGSENGLVVNIGFVDIHVPPSCLMAPSVWDNVQQAWAWQYQVEEGEAPVNLIYEYSQQIRVRIAKADINIDDNSVNSSSLELVGACDWDGLGMLSWWDEKQEES